MSFNRQYQLCRSPNDLWMIMILPHQNGVYPPAFDADSVGIGCIALVTRGLDPNETYPETGNNSVVFGGGCGICNVSLRKTRPSPSPSARGRGRRADRGAIATGRGRSRHAL